MNFDSKTSFSQKLHCYICCNKLESIYNYKSSCLKCYNFNVEYGFTTIYSFNIDGYNIFLQYFITSLNKKYVLCNYNNGKDCASFKLNSDDFNFYDIPPNELLKTLQMYNLYQ